MRQAVRQINWIGMALALLVGCTTDTTPPPAAHSEIQPHTLSAEERAYLGLPDGTPFSFAAVRADVLIVELFDMYCRVCQQSAPNVNELYQLIQQAGLGDKVKMVAIGAGNTPLEVEMYRRKYHSPFPVLSDRQRTLTAQLGSPKTPALLALRPDRKPLEPFYSHIGYLRNPDQVLEEIRTRAGL